MPTIHKPGRLPRLALAGAIVLIALAGCSDEDQLADIVVRAGNELNAASGNGVSTPPREMRVQIYNNVLSQLRGAMSGAGSEPGAEAAKLLIAQALLGQGDVAAENAGDARRELLYEITQTRSRLDLQSNRDTLAHAYSNYDPSADLEQLDGSEVEIEEELADLRATLADKQQRIQTLEAQMSEQKASAEERIAEASRVRAEAVDAGAVRRAELISQANEIERAADLHQKKLAELQLRAQSLTDEASEVRIRITSAQRREELVREARDRIRSSAQLLESQAAAATTDAQNIASELGAAFDVILEGFEQAELPAFEEAAAKYRDAAAQALQARGEVSTSAPAVAAMAQHASANLHLAQMDLLENLALLADDLATQLQAPRFTEAAGALHERLEEVRAQTADLYESAGSTYSRIGGAGLSESVQAFAGKLRGESPQQPGDADAFDEGDDVSVPADELDAPDEGAFEDPDAGMDGADAPTEPPAEPE